MKSVHSGPEGSITKERKKVVEEDDAKDGWVEAEVEVECKTEVVEATLAAFEVAKC